MLSYIERSCTDTLHFISLIPDLHFWKPLLFAMKKKTIYWALFATEKKTIETTVSKRAIHYPLILTWVFTHKIVQVSQPVHSFELICLELPHKHLGLRVISLAAPNCVCSGTLVEFAQQTLLAAHCLLCTLQCLSLQSLTEKEI